MYANYIPSWGYSLLPDVWRLFGAGEGYRRNDLVEKSTVSEQKMFVSQQLAEMDGAFFAPCLAGLICFAGPNAIRYKFCVIFPRFTCHGWATALSLPNIVIRIQKPFISQTIKKKVGLKGHNQRKTSQQDRVD